MILSFQRCATGESVSAADIDDMTCDDLDIDPDEDDFSSAFKEITHVGAACCTSGTFDYTKFQDLLQDESDELHELYIKYLFRDYIFSHKLKPE